MAGSVAKVIYKELQQINKKSLYDDTAVCEPYEADNPLKLKVLLTPQDGIYAGGVFEFSMDIPENYPNKAPKVTCKTKVYHPNISYEGAECLSMLSESNSNYQIEHYVNGLLFLFQHPNVESRLNSKVTSDASKLKVFVRESMMGKTVNGMKFPCVLQRELTFEEKLEVFLEGLDSKNLFATAFGSNTMDFPLDKLAQFIAANPTVRPKFEALLPFLKTALDAAMNITLSYAKTSSGGVLKRSAALNAPSHQVVKEMVVLLDEKPILLLTNGIGQIDTQSLSEQLGGKVEVPKMKQLRSLLKKPISFVSAFTQEANETVYVNESVLTEEFVFTASGSKWVIVKIKPSDLLSLLPNAKVLKNFCTPESPQPTTTNTVQDAVQDSQVLTVTNALEVVAL